MKNNVFERIKEGYFVLIWLLPSVYLPGAKYLANKILPTYSEWYWFDIIYYYYFHTILALSLLILMHIAKLNWRIMLGHIDKKEIMPSIKLTTFIFFFSISSTYLLFYPLSLVMPKFVQYWLIDTSPIIYSYNGKYPFLPNLLSVISLVILTPILEEFIFRGFLLHRWCRTIGTQRAVILSSVIFGIVHPDPIGAIAFGIAMCILYLRTRSLLIPILCHAINNLVVWLIEAGNFSYFGHEYTYTLDDFQREWYWGIAATVIVVLWIRSYTHKTKENKI